MSGCGTEGIAMRDDASSADVPIFLAATPVYTPANGHYEPHSHPHNELVLVQRGRLRSQLLGKNCVIASPDDILLYPPGTIHEEWAEDGKAVLILACSFKASGLHLLFHRDTHGRIQDLIARMVGTCLVADYPKEEAERRTAGLLRILIEELRQLDLDDSDVMVERVRAFIRDNLDQAFALDDLATVGGFTKHYFTRHYRQLTGRSPMEDARCIRLEEARRLIVNSGLSLREIAPMVGLGDGYRLSRLLRRHYNVGACDLRRTMQKNEDASGTI